MKNITAEEQVINCALGGFLKMIGRLKPFHPNHRSFSVAHNYWEDLA